MPAGHSFPPHSVSLVWRVRGGFRRPLKVKVTSCDGGWIVEGIRSSEIERNEGGLVVIVCRRRDDGFEV